MKPAAAQPAVKLSRDLPASPERVFRAWTDPDQLKRWHCPPGGSVTKTDLDLREGGKWSLAITDSQGIERVVAGEYKTIDPPNKLVYTWRWIAGDDVRDIGETLVTVDFQKTGDASTRVELSHEMLPTPETREKHARGWEGCFRNLGEEFASA